MLNQLISIDINNIPIKVKISEKVIDKIIKKLSYSDTIEGGKFVGKIKWSNRSIDLEILSYIDSGPRSKKSQTHINHDVEYQKHFLKLVKCYDAEIEHLGFWHSYHCSDTKELTSEDISRYAINIDDNYSLDYFLVMLISEIQYNQMDIKYYLVKKEGLKFTEIDHAKICYKYIYVPKIIDMLNFDEEAVRITSDGKVEHCCG